MNLNSQLQDYLSGSGSSVGNGMGKNSGSGNGNGGGFLGRGSRSPTQSLTAPANTSRFSWLPFSKNGGNGASDSGTGLGDDGGNGWFTQAQSDPLLSSLTKKQRVLGFIGCLLMGTFCFSLAGLYIPFLVLKARKFALLYTTGSLFVIASFSFLWGPVHHARHLLTPDRLPFTVAYFSTMIATLYFALSVQSTALTVIFAVFQILALVWYIVSYIPGGQTGLKFFSKIFYLAASKTVQKTLPV